MTATVPSFADASRDFADWLPPVLVKELRQGLRTRLFTSAFMLTHLVLIAVLSLHLLSERQGLLVQEIDQFLWIGIIVALVVIMPLRGLMAISDETQAGSLELVQLTHLGSGRIVLHKWIALISQTLLLVVTLLPYMVLRYFFGGMDVWFHLLTLGWLTLISMAFTAVCLTISPAGLFARLFVLGLLGTPSFFMTMEFVEHPDSFVQGHPPVLSLIYPLVAAIVFCLVLATKQLSGPGENGTTRLRLVTVALLLGATIAGTMSTMNEPQTWPMWLIPLIVVAALESLSESPSDYPSVLVPFVRRGLLGRLAGRWLYPGWTGGVLFVLLLTLILSGGVGWIARHDNDHFQGMTVLWSLGMALVFPAALMPLLPSFRHRQWLYVFVQMACLLTAICVTSIFHTYASVSHAFVSGLLPMSAMFWEMSHSPGSSVPWSMHVGVMVCTDVLILLIIAFHSCHEQRHVRRMEAEAERLLAEDAASSSTPTPVA